VLGYGQFINPATRFVVFSRGMPANSKASRRRCSTPTASFDNKAKIKITKNNEPPSSGFSDQKSEGDETP
jgi:hypothetical protein